MLHFIFVFIVLMHGLIHLLGYTHELQITAGKEFTNRNYYYKGTGKVINILWLVSYGLFLAAATLFMLYLDLWWIAAAAGVLLSQILIIVDWQQAKYGTLANIFIVLTILSDFGNWSF